MVLRARFNGRDCVSPNRVVALERSDGVVLSWDHALHAER
jgi:hypothetical protein